jgi:Ca2+-binding EF-hand superfamily protein
MDPGTMFRLSRQMDTNGDLLVEEKELNDGFQKFTQDAAAVHADLLAWLDKDKDGALSQEEWRPFYTAMSLLPLVRSADQNNDMVLQDTELDAAFARMAEFCQSANDRTLQQFDRDHDGKLSEEELQAARQAMQRFGGMRGPRGGGPDGAGGPAPGGPPPPGGGPGPAPAPAPAPGAAR